MNQRSILRVLTLAVVFLAPVRVFAQDAAAVTCKDGSTGKTGKGACSHHGGVDKGGAPAAKPASAEKPALPESAPQAGATATVTCKGSTGKAGKGACSHHGGVQKGAANDNATPPAVTTQRAEPPTATKPVERTEPTPAPSRTTVAPGQATAKCKDGTLSMSKHHSGTCSHHGGVAQWLDGSQ